MSGPSDDQTEEQVARRYLRKIDEALGELTLDEVRQVVQELEASIMCPAKPACSIVDC
jgi:hypothetical protein